jgi:hypothetical protein
LPHATQHPASKNPTLEILTPDRRQISGEFFNTIGT